MENYRHVKFHPWVGKGYSSRSFFGKKILILGESHYGSDHDGDYAFTSHVVQDWALSKRLRFFSIIAKSILLKGSGDYLSQEDREQVWHNVAFYNYVQSFVAETSRVRPTNEMWMNSKKPLIEVLEKLGPDIILAFGRELEYRLRTDCEDVIDGKFLFLPHPSGRSFKYSNVIPVIAEKLN